MSEQISALMDDEIAVEDAAHLIAAIHNNKHAAEAWTEYHLIGDVMRDNAMLSRDFRQNLMQKLEQEPTVLAPQAARAGREVMADFKEKLPIKWSIAASFAAVMLVGWMALQQQVQPQGVAPVMTVAQSEMAEPQIPSEYLSAHQASVPSASSYYIQTVNYTE